MADQGPAAEVPPPVEHKAVPEALKFDHELDHTVAGIVAAAKEPYHRQGDMELHTGEEHLKQRQALRHSPHIRQEIERIWQKLRRNSEGRLELEAYLEFSLAVMHVLRPDVAHQDESAIKMLEEEFKQDSGGASSLTFDQFHTSLFELADIWTPNIGAQEYVDFLRKIDMRSEHYKPRAAAVVKSYSQQSLNNNK